MDCYILYTALLVIISLFVIAIICYYYAKHREKLKKEHIAILKIQKWKIINFKIFVFNLI